MPADGDASRLRARRLRRLHGAREWQGYAFMPSPRGDVRWLCGADSRRISRRSHHGRAAPAVPRVPCVAVRILHARHVGDGARYPAAFPEPGRADRPQPVERTDLPLHRLCQHHQGRDRGRPGDWRRCRGLKVRQLVRPLCPHARVELLAGARDGWKRPLSIEWNTSVDDDAGIALVIDVVIAHRIERRAPAAMDDIDLNTRIAAGAHRPDDVVDVGRIDVLIHDNGPTITVGAGMAMWGAHAGLLGVPAVKLLDGDGQHETATSGFVRP